MNTNGKSYKNHAMRQLIWKRKRKQSEINLMGNNVNTSGVMQDSWVPSFSGKKVSLTKVNTAKTSHHEHDVRCTSNMFLIFYSNIAVLLLKGSGLFCKVT